MKVEDINELYKSSVKRKLIASSGKEFELEIHKLGTDELPLLAELDMSKLKDLKDDKNQPIPKEFLDLIKKLVTVTLRRSLEDATDKDNLELPLEYLFDVFDGILEANAKAFKDKVSEEDKEIIDKIKSRQKVK